jgi:hypothetical protein
MQPATLTLATLNGLMAATQTELPLSDRAKALLSRETIIVRTIDSGSHTVLFPLPPDEVIGDEPPIPSTLSKEEREAEAKRRSDAYRAREQHWMRTAPEAERIAYRLALERVKFHTIALAAIEPRLTSEQAERLGDAATDVYIGILRFSGLVKDAEA